MTLTFDLWPWEPFQQCPLISRIFVASFVEIPPISIQRYRVAWSRYQRASGRTDRKQTDGQTERPPGNIMSLPPIAGEGAIKITENFYQRTASGRIKTFVTLGFMMYAVLVYTVVDITDNIWSVVHVVHVHNAYICLCGVLRSMVFDEQFKVLLSQLHTTSTTVPCTQHRQNRSWGQQPWSVIITYLALRSSGPLWDNGQQVSPEHTVGCHCLFLAPADSSCL